MVVLNIVVGEEREDHGVGMVGKGPVTEREQLLRRSEARHAEIHDLDALAAVRLAGGEPLLQHASEIPPDVDLNGRGHRVAQDRDPHSIGWLVQGVPAIVHADAVDAHVGVAFADPPSAGVRAEPPARDRIVAVERRVEADADHSQGDFGQHQGEHEPERQEGERLSDVGAHRLPSIRKGVDGGIK